MGDVAGILELIFWFYLIFLSKFIEQSYNLNILGNVYLAKIKDKSMMQMHSLQHHIVENGIQSLVLKGKDKKDRLAVRELVKNLPQDNIDELKSHTTIKLLPTKKAKLFVYYNFLFCCKSVKKDKLFRLYSKGVDKIEHATDI